MHTVADDYERETSASQNEKGSSHVQAELNCEQGHENEIKRSMGEI